MGSRRVDVALPLPVRSTFTYSLEGPPPPPVGTRVLVPFRRQERIGWVVGAGLGPEPQRVRPVLDLLETEPSVSPELMELARWVADYYLVPLGMVLRTFLPSVLSDSSRDFLSLVRDPGPGGTPREQRLLDALRASAGPRRVRGLRRELGMGSLWPEIRRLVAEGLVRHHAVPPRDPPIRTQKVVRIREWLSDLARREEVFGRASRQREAYEILESGGGTAELKHLTDQCGFSASVIKGLMERGVVQVEDEEVFRDPFAQQDPGEAPDLTPTPRQESVLQTLRESVSFSSSPPVLLHGVTGSGKTLVYIELLKHVVQERGQGAIVLVPEIALTPQTVARFRAFFGDEVAVLHSGLSEGERYDAWRQLRQGEKRIAVGARSAVFAPVPGLGAIVVDEEHDGSYKQSEGPRYHARDVAIVRAVRSGALCLLGSATPSLESWRNAENGRYRLESLHERVGGGTLPPVRVVDLRETWKRQKDRKGRDPGGGALSPQLVSAVEARLQRREQVILLLNRRGYSNFVQCRECGNVWRCVRCSVSLTFHKLTGKLLCHYCRHEEPSPSRCQRCGSEELSFRGLGTEQVERIVGEAFPSARLARMDVDTTSGKWSHHEILGRFGRGEVDILLGTQMISKGLDFPRVTLVGVVNADVGMHLPDFRASERTFQLLSQVAGRAGRGKLGGEVLVQTSLPDHFAVKAALEHDFPGFASRELAERRTPAYPPHVRLANVLLSGPRAEDVAREAERSSAWVRRAATTMAGGVEVVGPAPAPIEKLHGRWRWHFLVRSPSSSPLGTVLESFLDGHRPRGRDIRIVVDRDPVALL